MQHGTQVASSVEHHRPRNDERLQETSTFRRLLRRPELGALAGLVFVVAFFLATASPSMFSLAGIINILEPAAQLGIVAIGASLLMIGGEFDLSVGSMIAFSGLVFGSLLVALQIALPIAILATLAMAAGVGVVNSTITIRTGLPSFIVTLAFMFILRGLSLVGIKTVTGGASQLRGFKEAVGEGWVAELFSGDALTGLFSWMASNGWIGTFGAGTPVVKGIPVVVIWFFLIAIASAFVLVRTRFGNWIFAVGGDMSAARNSGVPVVKVKTALFILAACCAALVGILTVLDAGSTDARRGFQKEFEAIIAAVIGGCLLTGGYGSTIGAFFGAIIFGMVLIGLTYTGIDQDWYLVFLGGMLLIAVIFNSLIRKRVTGER